MDGVQSVYFTETRIENKMLFVKTHFHLYVFILYLIHSS